jgi:hypothetical protein
MIENGESHICKSRRAPARELYLTMLAHLTPMACIIKTSGLRGPNDAVLGWQMSSDLQHLDALDALLAFQAMNAAKRARNDHT